MFYLLLISSCFLIPTLVTCGELRFCHNGPHKMLQNECPGGFVFKSVVTPTCKYFAKETKIEGEKEVVLSAPLDLCNDDSARAIEGSGDDLKDIGEFTWFQWEEDDSGNFTEGKFDPEDICTQECLAEYEEAGGVVDEEPIPDDWDASKVTPEQKEYCRTINKKMFMKLLMDDFDSDEPTVKSAPPKMDLAGFTPGNMGGGLAETKIASAGTSGSDTQDLTGASNFGKTKDLGARQNSADKKDSSGAAILPATKEFSTVKIIHGTIGGGGAAGVMKAGRPSELAWTPGNVLNADAGIMGSNIPTSAFSETKSSKPVGMATLSSSLITTAQYDSSNLNVIKLLAKSMKIVMSTCSPFLREEFYEQVLKGMLFISKMFESFIVDIGPDLYKQIASLLDHCGLKRHQEFYLNGTRCEGNEKIDGIYYTRNKKYWEHRLTGRSFRWGKYHPIIDAAWTTIDIVHSFCFESFLKNMMLGHVYAVGMEGLFMKNISVLWRVEPGVKNDKFWNNVMQTFDLNITMRNLDACSVAARIHSPFMSSLPRPFVTMEELKKPAPPPPSSVTVKGWNKTVEKYWEHYEQKGGFAKVSEGFGRCFQEPNGEELDDMIGLLKSSKSC